MGAQKESESDTCSHSVIGLFFCINESLFQAPIKQTKAIYCDLHFF
jgi:hypothetical protein